MHPNPPQTDLKRYESAPHAHAFFHLGAHLKETEFLYPDQSWKEPCGMMANLVAENNENGGLSLNRKKALCSGFRSLGRRVSHRTADCAAEREYAAFCRRLIGENMSCANATDITLRTATGKEGCYQTQEG
ncbi:MAG: hypothetical protein MJZ81_03390 [Bacteroidales bacterium]|nr:hypothetical protein [Bacteroidales bacterium]